MTGKSSEDLSPRMCVGGVCVCVCVCVRGGEGGGEGWGGAGSGGGGGWRNNAGLGK